MTYAIRHKETHNYWGGKLEPRQEFWVTKAQLKHHEYFVYTAKLDDILEIAKLIPEGTVTDWIPTRAVQVNFDYRKHTGTKIYKRGLYVKRYEQFEFKLLPCPACKSDDLFVVGNAHFRYWVFCCDCRTRSGDVNDPTKIPEKWNWRGSDETDK
jgi:hypothetical protein